MKRYQHVVGAPRKKIKKQSLITNAGERKVNMGVTVVMKDKVTGVITRQTLGKAGTTTTQPKEKEYTIESSGWSGRRAGGGAGYEGKENRSREILAQIHSVMVEKVKRDKTIRAQDYSRFSPDEALRVQRAAIAEGDRDSAVKLQALHEDLVKHRTLVQGRITKSKYPGIYSKNEADRAGDAAERNAGIALAQMAGSMQRATQTLKKLRSDHRISAASAFLEGLEARGSFSDSDNIATATAFHREAKEFKQEIGVEYFEIEKATIEKAGAFIEGVAQVTKDGVTLNVSAPKLMELGLIAQVGEDSPGETDPESLAGAVREERAIQDELDELREQGDPDAPPDPAAAAEAARLAHP